MSNSEPVLRAADMLARAVADFLESGAGDAPGLEHVTVPMSHALAVYHTTAVLHEPQDAPSVPEQRRARERLAEMGWSFDAPRGG